MLQQPLTEKVLSASRIDLGLADGMLRNYRAVCCSTILHLFPVRCQLEQLEHTEGFEPSCAGLQDRCCTIEPQVLIYFSKNLLHIVSIPPFSRTMYPLSTPCPQQADTQFSTRPKQASYPSAVGILPHLGQGRSSASIGVPSFAYTHFSLMYLIEFPRLYDVTTISPPKSLLPFRKEENGTGAFI